MFPLWDAAIAPVLEAAGARRIVEIGALKGETTVKMLDRLGPDAELHVIDPVPDFDPAEHEKAFGGQYVFHQALSLDAIPGLPPMDAALIDGDHNWYTVYHELTLLAKGARDAGAPTPVFILHDVLWPYGRRDLYYAPETIPAEFRHPWERKGMVRGRSELLENGGLSPGMCNATHEGGPRNGVMTAVEDFIAEYDRPLRRIVLPVYFGLAILVEEERIAAEPDLAAALERLDAADGRLDLMRVAESARLRAMVFQHNVAGRAGQQLERARAKHLDVVKSALLNEHYLDHEIALRHLVTRAAVGLPPFVERLRDPRRAEQTLYRKLEQDRLGPAGPDDGAASSFLPYTAMGRPRLDHLQRCLDTLRSEGVDGDLVECGTGRGGGAIFLRAYLDAHEIEAPTVWVADEFRASPAPSLDAELDDRGIEGLQADLNLVRDGFDRFGLLDDRVRFIQGPMPEVLGGTPITEISLLRIGRSIGPHGRDALEALLDRVVDGGYVVVEENREAGLVAAAEAFRADHGITAPIERIDAGTIAWRKAPSDSVRAESSAAPTGAVLAPPAPPEPVDLSVVVVFYNMRREAARTLRALSRSYQQDIDGLDYEVLVVENGSDPDQRLSQEFVAELGPEFRYIDMGDDATSSPVPALNRGIREGRGNHFALMIDGAHVLTPGVLRHGMDALHVYAPAMVATQQWYVGPGQQGDAMDDGYDTAYEDRLFEAIDWPHDGYRLFEIGHFIGDRDWFDGMWESNCIFASRAQLEQVGMFDESFTVAGGGYANLELYERLGSAPDVTVASIIGEGSFHQVHGGTTTNQIDPAERRSRVFGYSQDYAAKKGRPFKGPGKPIHFVGAIRTPGARRSKPRRLTAAAFEEGSHLLDGDGMPDHPTPLPDELKWSFTEAVWRTLPWTHTSWMGRAIRSAPTDLFAYQELVSTVRPDVIIEAGTGDGGRTLFLASMCDLVGHGRVISVDHEQGEDLPTHERITYVRGRAHQPKAIEKVMDAAGSGARALVILGSIGNRYETTKQFEVYSPLVPVGSYVVVTDTVVNGHPVWPAFGPGPMESVKQVLASHGGFIQDPAMEKYSLTFNPGGFLKRVQ